MRRALFAPFVVVVQLACGSPPGPERTSQEGMNPGQSGRFAYVSNLESTVSAYAVDSGGCLREVPGSPFQTHGLSTRSILLHPTGRWAYVGHFLTNNIAGFKIDDMTGRLAHVEGSPFPSGGELQPILHPSGRFLYLAEFSPDRIWGFSIDPSVAFA